MSQQATDAAVEKILADPDFAAQVYQDPEKTLTSQFELLPGEWRAISACLQQDVQDSVGDVKGHLYGRDTFVSLQYGRLIQLPGFYGSINFNAFGPTAIPSRG